MPHSDAIEAAVTRHASKLDELCPDVMRCRVGVILDEKHKHQGKPFNVRIDVTVPGHELVSNREHDEDVYVACATRSRTPRACSKTAFENGAAKSNTTRNASRASSCGSTATSATVFIQDAQENDYYFRPENLADLAFEHREIRTPVHFIAGIAAEGRQAYRISKASS